MKSGLLGVKTSEIRKQQKWWALILKNFWMLAVGSMSMRTLRLVLWDAYSFRALFSRNPRGFFPWKDRKRVSLGGPGKRRVIK